MTVSLGLSEKPACILRPPVSTHSPLLPCTCACTVHVRAARERESPRRIGHRRRASPEPVSWARQVRQPRQPREPRESNAVRVHRSLASSGASDAVQTCCTRANRQRRKVGRRSGREGREAGNERKGNAPVRRTHTTHAPARLRRHLRVARRAERDSANR